MRIIARHWTGVLPCTCILIFSTCTICVVTSFCPPRIAGFQTRKYTTTELYSLTVNKTGDSGTNFWNAVSRKNDIEDGTTGSRTVIKVPVVPSLDADGPLPPGAYHVYGKDQFLPKPTCILSVAVNLNIPDGEEIMDPGQIVDGMQQCIDSGLTSFQLGIPKTTRKKAEPERKMKDDDYIQEQLYSSHLQAWGEENVYGKLQKTTPRSVLKACHMAVPFSTPSALTHSSQVNKNSIREAITESLSRIGTESIDTLQLECKCRCCFYTW